MADHVTFDSLYETLRDAIEYYESTAIAVHIDLRDEYVTVVREEGGYESRINNALAPCCNQVWATLRDFKKAENLTMPELFTALNDTRAGSEYSQEAELKLILDKNEYARDQSVYNIVLRKGNVVVDLYEEFT